MPDVRLTAVVSGYVQGVGFRYWTRKQALRLGLTGHAVNLPDGSVEVVAVGATEACERLLGQLRGGKTPGEVTEVTEQWDEPAVRPALFTTGTAPADR